MNPIERAVALRHALHADPEVGLDLPRTTERVLAALAPLGLEIHRSARSSSFAAVLRGAGEGPAVLLRADMDGLPIDEATGLAYASGNGAMHACGHDVHTAALVGTAHGLAARREELAGDVVLLFQAGEEAFDGARILIEDGLLEAPGVEIVAAFALHVLSDSPLGEVRSRSGAVTGYGTSVRAVFAGAGGHGATPHLARDPIPALVAALGQIPVALTRGVDPHEAVVFTPGFVHAGVRRNVIPDSAEFDATLRTFDPAVREQAVAIIERVVRGAAVMHGIEVDVAVTTGYPAVLNDPAEHALARAVAASVGLDVVEAPHPAAMTEDFSRIAERFPSAFVFLGARAPGLGAAAPNHAGNAVFDDAAIEAAVAFETAWALRRLTAVRSAQEHP